MKTKRSKIDLIFERIPPFISWSLITMPFWGGFLIPEFTADVVIFFNIYFLYKSISLCIFIFLSYLNIRESESINWLSRLQELTNIPAAITRIKERLDFISKQKFTGKYTDITDQEKLNQVIKNRIPGIIKKYLFFISKRKIINFLKNEQERLVELQTYPPVLDWRELKHIVIIPHWKEPFSVLEDTLKRLRDLNYPTDHISVVLAAEARDENGYEKSLKLQQLFSQYFEHIWITSHIMEPGELVGKSSNMAFASKKVYEEVMKLGWDLSKVTVTSCDADSQLPADYFGNLSYLYVTMPDAQYKYFTGAVQLYANIWRLPFFARVKNSMSTIYNVGRLVRTDKLVPFSTYTTSFWMIKQIGFWSADIIPEDFHTFFKGLFLFPDKVSTIPIYQRILSDAAEGEGSLDTIKNNYFQERRWSWGISDDGWILKNMIRSVLKGKFTIRSLYIAFHIVFDHISGVGLALLVSLGGWIPLLINPRFAYTAFGFNLPIVSEFIVKVTIFFLVIMIAIDGFMKPQMDTKPPLWKRFLLVIEWIVQPVTGILMVTLPGFEAHTRLLFGRYLEYYLTKKKD
jgi:hypothetical protein